MGLIAAAQERPFAEDELFVWMADGGGVILAAEPVFTRLCGADPAGQALAALAEPVPLLGRPDAAVIKHVAADGAFFWAMVFTLPVAAGVLGVGFKPVARSGFVDEVAARRQRHVRGDRAVMTLRELLGGVSAGLAKHASLAASFERRSDFVVELAEEIRLFSM